MEEGYIKDKVFESQDFTIDVLPDGEYDGCSFSNCNFSSCDISGRVFSDCRFDNSNLSLVVMNRTSLMNVTFSGCKMFGIQLNDCNQLGLALTFDSCQLNHSSFYQMKLKGTKFKNCSLIEVDFTQAELNECGFEHCDLSGATFDRTQLEKADFTTALNYIINPEVNNIKKARFSAEGLAGLLQQYAIVIEP